MNKQKSFELIKELGQGSQGTVYLIEDSNQTDRLAAKVFQKSDRFELEKEILCKLKGKEGFPQIHSLTKIDDQKVIVMNLLGESLKHLKDKYGKFSVNTCLQLAYQLVTRLQTLHKIGYVHCDLKPDNILISRETGDSSIYIVDYALSHLYIDRQGNHIKQPAKVSFKGSISYCSLNLLNKQHASRRDDLESLIYVIIYLLEGQLPWHDKAQGLQGMERLNYVIKMKLELKLKQYSLNIPRSLFKCYKYIRSLTFTQEPDYDKLRYFIKKDLNNLGFEIDGIYDWNHKCISPVQRLQLYTSLCQNKCNTNANQNPQAIEQFAKKSSYEKEFERRSIESISMEADYKDFMSLEFDEGINIDVKELSTNSNDLRSISPCLSPHSMKLGSPGNEELKEDILRNKRSKQMHSFNIRPFSIDDSEQDQRKDTEEVEDFDEFFQIRKEYIKQNTTQSLAGIKNSMSGKDYKVEQLDLQN